jgi:tetratricopeptide (TPR) repeat protein
VEGVTWLSASLTIPGADPVRSAQAFHDLGMLLFWQGKNDEALGHFETSEAVARAAGDVNVTALALVAQARVALRTDVEQARRLCRAALDLTEGASDTPGRSAALHVLGVAAQMTGDLAEAKRVMSERLAMGRQTGNLPLVSSEAGNLCMVERRLGNLHAAELLGREALEIDMQRRDARSIPWKVNGLAAVAAAAGEDERAARLIGIADATMDQSGGAWPPDELVQYNETAELLTARLGGERFNRCRAAGRAMDAEAALAFALRGVKAGSE